MEGEEVGLYRNCEVVYETDRVLVSMERTARIPQDRDQLSASPGPRDCAFMRPLSSSATNNFAEGSSSVFPVHSTSKIATFNRCLA